MADKNLNELFLDTLKDIYYAEKQILKALPKMAKAANSDELRAAFEKHHDETEGQIERLEQVFELLGKPRAARNAMPSRVSSTKARRSWRNTRDTPALDAGLLAAAQAVEHYEISRYGTLKAWAPNSTSRPQSCSIRRSRKKRRPTNPDQACGDRGQLRSRGVDRLSALSPRRGEGAARGFFDPPAASFKTLFEAAPPLAAMSGTRLTR